MHDQNPVAEKRKQPAGGLTSAYLEFFGIYRYNLVGSRFAVDPPVTDTDIDLLCLTIDAMSAVKFSLISEGWLVHTPEDPEYENAADEIPFITARRGLYNLIIYQDPIGFGLFLGAMRVCKLHNWKDKENRVLAVRAATEENFFDTFGDDYA